MSEHIILYITRMRWKKHLAMNRRHDSSEYYMRNVRANNNKGETRVFTPPLNNDFEVDFMRYFHDDLTALPMTFPHRFDFIQVSWLWHRFYNNCDELIDVCPNLLESNDFSYENVIPDNKIYDVNGENSINYLKIVRRLQVIEATIKYMDHVYQNDSVVHERLWDALEGIKMAKNRENFPHGIIAFMRADVVIN